MDQNMVTLDLSRPSQESLFYLHREVIRRSGNMRSVTLGYKLVNTDQQLGIMRAMKESIELAFGVEKEDPQLELGE